MTVGVLLGVAPPKTPHVSRFCDVFFGGAEISTYTQLKALRCMRIVDTDRLLLAREDGCSSHGCGRVRVIHVGWNEGWENSIPDLSMGD